VAIDLNGAGQIERLDTTWDNAVMSDADLQALVLRSIENKQSACGCRAQSPTPRLLMSSVCSMPRPRKSLGFR